MPSAQLTEFLDRANTFRAEHMGGSIKVSGTTTPATWTSQRIRITIGDSLVRVDRYHATVHILKADVPSITTPAAWMDSGITIQLPEGTGWRSYRITVEPTNVHLNAEWKLDLESL